MTKHFSNETFPLGSEKHFWKKKKIMNGFLLFFSFSSEATNAAFFSRELINCRVKLRKERKPFFLFGSSGRNAIIKRGKRFLWETKKILTRTSVTGFISPTENSFASNRDFIPSFLEQTHTTLVATLCPACQSTTLNLIWFYFSQVRCHRMKSINLIKKKLNCHCHPKEPRNIFRKILVYKTEKIVASWAKPFSFLFLFSPFFYDRHHHVFLFFFKKKK